MLPITTGQTASTVQTISSEDHCRADVAPAEPNSRASDVANLQLPTHAWHAQQADSECSELQPASDNEGPSKQTIAKRSRQDTLKPTAGRITKAARDNLQYTHASSSHHSDSACSSSSCSAATDVSDEVAITAYPSQLQMYTVYSKMQSTLINLGCLKDRLPV